MSQLVAENFEDDSSDDEDEDSIKTIPLPNVRSEVLKLVIEYGKHYQEEPMTAIETPLKSSQLEDLVQEWYVNFVAVEEKVLFDLVAAANYMDIKPLLDLTCLAVSIVTKVSFEWHNLHC
jgi:S-phase kinase-associated protein 1